MAYLDHLRTFLSIYRAGTLSGAAQVLHMTQPAVSGHLKILEQQMGKALFVRLPRGVRPTPAGEHFARRIEPFMDGLEVEYISARQDTIDISGALHIGGPPEFMAAKVLPTLSDLSEVGIRVRAQLGSAVELIDSLKAGNLDLVLATVRIANKQIEYTRVYEENFHLVGARKWLNVAPTLKGLLNRVPVLAYGENLPIIRRYFQAHGVSLDGIAASLSVADLRGLMSCAQAGAGMTVLPDYLCLDTLKDGSLVRLHTSRKVEPNTLYIAHSKTIKRNARAAYVREILLKASLHW